MTMQQAPIFPTFLVQGGLLKCLLEKMTLHAHWFYYRFIDLCTYYMTLYNSFSHGWLHLHTCTCMAIILNKYMYMYIQCRYM